MRPAAIRVSTDWLALRQAADWRARDSAGNLAAELAAFLRKRRQAGPVKLVDVGAGTGSGAAWLTGHLASPQRWRLVDHDANLLAHASPVVDGWAEPVVADLLRLAAVLDGDPADAITCQALLDLLTVDDLRAIIEPALIGRAAVLASLTVTGATRLTPAHPDDGLVAAAFNAHQHRGGRLGPDAAAAAADMLSGAGYLVTTAATPWRLGRGDEALITQWLQGRINAAAEQQPGEAHRIRQWFGDREETLRRGELTVVVDHADVLGIPPM